MARLAWFSRTICTDCTSRSFQCHTSTFARGVSLSGGSGSCSLFARNTRRPLALHVRALSSLSTIPAGKPVVCAGSSTASRGAAARSRPVNTSSTLSRCTEPSFLSPRSTARPVPCSFQESCAYSAGAVSSARTRPLPMSNTYRPLPALSAASTV